MNDEIDWLIVDQIVEDGCCIPVKGGTRNEVIRRMAAKKFCCHVISQRLQIPQKYLFQVARRAEIKMNSVQPEHWTVQYIERRPKRVRKSRKKQNSD